MSDEDLFEMSNAVYDVNSDEEKSVEFLSKKVPPEDSSESNKSFSDSFHSTDSPRLKTFSPRSEERNASPRWRASGVGSGTLRGAAAAPALSSSMSSMPRALASSQDVLIGARRTKETLQLTEEVKPFDHRHGKADGFFRLLC
jgi:hypothetical protein